MSITELSSDLSNYSNHLANQLTELDSAVPTDTELTTLKSMKAQVEFVKAQIFILESLINRHV